MNKTRILSLLLCLCMLCTLILPAAAAEGETPSTDNGMKVSKTAKANDDGSYTITLEAFATGEQLLTKKETPTDIILVLDQSGSMTDPMGGFKYTAYRQSTRWFDDRNYYNGEYYPLRHNSGSENLWYKLADDEYVSVSVEKEMAYNTVSNKNNSWYNSNQKNLYCLISGEYKRVTVDYTYHLFAPNDYKYKVDGREIASSTGDSEFPNFAQYAPLYLAEQKYTYSYTLDGNLTQIEVSQGADNSPETQFYSKKYSNSATTRRAALKSAATRFVNAVAAKAAGEDGNINTTADNINHRIAVVGFADTKSGNGANTGVFIGSTLHKYSAAAANVYTSAFQNMDQPTGISNVTASLNALQASGATRTDYGLTMAKGILDANPVTEGETRNRVVIVFTDGAPTSSNGFEKAVANDAISTATTIKNGGTTVYSIGIFNGADATSAGTNPNVNNSTSLTAACNWFMQNISSNNGTPRTDSYYLSADDAGSLNSIFDKISNQITGGSSVELDSSAVVKDTISPYFQLPANATENSITVQTAKCEGAENGDLQWATPTASTLSPTIDKTTGQVSVTGFDFSANWCGKHYDKDTNAEYYDGHKLIISFKVQPKPGFLGGNGVPTNGADSGVYAGDGTQVKQFDVPTVNVPIKAVTVEPEDKNVYLLGTVTAEQLKSGAKVQVGGVSLDLSKPNYGLANWQTEHVQITVTVKDANDQPITNDLKNLTDDAAYTIEVKVAPLPDAVTSAQGTPATEKTGNSTKNINVFKPELTFKDSEGYYGENVPTEFNNNQVGTTEWKHNGIEAVPNQMIGNAPALVINYTADTSKLSDGKLTKQDVPVKAEVKIDETPVNQYTTFKHQPCNPVCGWAATDNPGDPAFLIHVNTCTLKVTKTGGADGEPYVFTVYKDNNKYTEVTIVGNTTQTIVELPVGEYTIQEDTGWSWRYPNPKYSDSVALSATAPEGTITCTNTSNNNKWLNGFSGVVRNIFATVTIN